MDKVHFLATDGMEWKKQNQLTVGDMEILIYDLQSACISNGNGFYILHQTHFMKLIAYGETLYFV
jgi:hypothetical protein